MKAVGYKKPLPITDPESLLDIEISEPKPEGRDLLVRVHAVSINPVDTKMRSSAPPPEGQEHRILGYDAAGIVEAVGPDVTLFQIGDEVWYAGSIVRSGTNAELHLVDERIVAKKPESLDFTHAAAMPLTTITAWELLFDRLGVPRGSQSKNQTLFIMGGAGGVGSILTQLARQLTSLTIVSTSSRPETASWSRELGAHHVVNHKEPLGPQLKNIGRPQVDYVAALTGSQDHFPKYPDILKPQGRIAMTDDPESLNINILKQKAISFHWELMFTRSRYETEDMIAQHDLLASVAKLVDEGRIRTTLGQDIGKINAENLKKAHASSESGKSQGKIVLSGF